ncbi:MAG: N-acetylneuraminate synthase family protein [Alphaproteobacteria bacterium]|nr:N-acetylneuraminate synthase family protein [Alphaproteobacteria bacterium]
MPERPVIAPGQPCFIAAEIGINHNGDLDLARRSIDAAKAAGADGVKFQNYRTEDFLRDRSLTYRYRSQGRDIVERQYDLFKRCELDREALTDLARYCREIGMAFFTTPTGETGLADAVAAGAVLLKNGSDYLTHLPLIEAMARTGIATVLSTGMSTLAEIDDAVRAFRRAGGEQLVLLHCVSAYPAPLASAHLRKIPVMAAAFDCPVGFSDHTEGVVAAAVAVGLGAVMVEKHFTLDRGLPGPDHWFSSDPAELTALVAAIRGAEASLGSPSLGPATGEAEMRDLARLSCVAARDLPAGHVLAAADIAFARPGTGLAPKGREWLCGRRVAAPVPTGHVFAQPDFVS